MEEFLYEVLYCFLYGPIYVFGFLQGYLSSAIESFVKGFKYAIKRNHELLEEGKSVKEITKILLEEAKQFKHLEG